MPGSGIQHGKYALEVLNEAIFRAVGGIFRLSRPPQDLSFKAQDRKRLARTSGFSSPVTG